VTARLALSPEAAEDLREAADWYDGQQPGHGDVFLQAVEACLSRIERLPRAFPEGEAGVRSALLRRFPYVVLFRIAEKRIEVLAVWHGRRDPRSRRERL